MTRPLVLCHFSLVEIAPPELVTVAARAGFSAVSLMLQFPRGLPGAYPMLGDTPMRRETRRRLEDTGVALYDAATCRIEPDTDVEDFRPMLESAAYLGARRFGVNGNDAHEERLAERFAALCALGAEYGLGAGLEFMMISQVRTLADAARLIGRAGATNAALTIDATHLARSGGTPADVAALDPALISYVQLSDGPAQLAAEHFLYEAGSERALPGMGDFPLRDLVAAVPDDMPLGVEAPSQKRRDAGLGADAYAASIMSSLRQLLA
jgi:sugar phosphate isomerase/epimerase